LIFHYLRTLGPRNSYSSSTNTPPDLQNHPIRPHIDPIPTRFRFIFDDESLLFACSAILHNQPALGPPANFPHAKIGNRLNGTQNHPMRPHMQPHTCPLGALCARRHAHADVRKGAPAPQDGPELTQDGIFEGYLMQNQCSRGPEPPVEECWLPAGPGPRISFAYRFQRECTYVHIWL
jgi:hypothetical protein